MVILMEKDKISQIPFYDIIDYFKQVHVSPDWPKDGANKFPKALQDKLDGRGIKMILQQRFGSRW